MTNTTITNFRKNVFDFVNSAVRYNDVIHVSTKSGNAVLLSEEEYAGMLETLYLMSIPGMVDSIQKAAAEPVEEGKAYDPEEKW